jgi:hypothetical protein
METFYARDQAESIVPSDEIEVATALTLFVRGGWLFR